MAPPPAPPVRTKKRILNTSTTNNDDNKTKNNKRCKVDKDEMKNEIQLSSVLGSMLTVPLRPLPWIGQLHPTVSHITFIQAGLRSKFTINGRTVKGLTKVLASRVYPSYQFVDAKKTVSSLPLPSPSSKPSTTPRWKTKNASTRQRAGMNRGKALDRKLTRLLQLMIQYKLPAYPSKQLYESNVGYKKLMTCLQVKNHPHARLLWTKWNEMGLKLVATQVSVGIHGKCATNIDCILTNAYHELLIVEIKSGGDSYWTQHTNTPMNPPFNDLNDSKMNQALLQAAFGQYMYELTYPLHALYVRSSALVFRVTPTDVYWYKVPISIRSRVSSAMQSII